jgi:hypothetical protein
MSPLNAAICPTTYLERQKCYGPGKKIDALKVWTMWKAKGDTGMAADIDNLFTCSK